MILTLCFVMPLIMEFLSTTGQLSVHGREVRYSLQLGKYGTIPMVLTLSSVMLLIVDDRITFEGSLDISVHNNFGPCQFRPITKSAFTISAHRYNNV